MSEPGKERKQMGDVEPHLRTEAEIRELQPRVDFMAQRMCQTQGMVLWALKEAGLTVVLLDPRAREMAPDGAELAAAEERGRRRGVEEADGTVRSAVRLALACAAEIADSIDNIVTRRVIARRIRALIPPPQGNTVWPDPAHDGVVERLRVAIDAALAPRDSGKEGSA